VIMAHGGVLSSTLHRSCCSGLSIEYSSIGTMADRRTSPLAFHAVDMGWVEITGQGRQLRLTQSGFDVMLAKEPAHQP
jgi:hypothetical protein